MLKKSLGIALLCIMGQAYSAEIVVTTTEDIVRMIKNVPYVRLCNILIRDG